ncbi:MAG: right-handed parallel beta-helix repeat-containing protein, partial [Promethearchaeota archaeon]
MNNKVVFLGFFVVMILLSSSFQTYESTALIEDCQSVSVIQEKVVDRFQPAYEEHSPISIAGDQNLTIEAEAESWDGMGTLEYPFIIEEYNITLSGSGTCIALYNISLYVVIRDCFIGGGDTGIYLSNVSRFTSIDNSIYSNFRGMDITDCDHSVITSTIFTDNYYHIDLDDAVNIQIEGCQFNTGNYGIVAQYLAYSWIVNNTIIDLTDGILIGSYCIGNEIRQNSISEVYFYAIRFSDNAQSNTVLWNSFQADLGSAIDISTDPENEFSHNY